MGKLNKYVGGFTLRLNAITTVGSLISVQESKKKTKASFVNVTPDGRRVEQRYVPVDNPDGDEIYFPYQLEKATVTKDDDDNEVVTLVGKENVAEASASQLPKNTLTLAVHDREEVDASVYHSGEANSYVFVPDSDDPANVQWYELIRELVARSGKAFVGVANVKGYEGFFQLREWRGQIVLDRQLYPSDVKPHPVVGSVTDLKTSTYDKALKAVEKMTIPFDADAYVNDPINRVKELEAQAVAGTLDVDAVVASGSKTATIDMDAALDAMFD